MTDLSIIIVCYKGWERLNKCLDAIDLFSRANLKTEVIVVDNNSGGEKLSDTEARFPKFIFIRNEINGGFGNGCNMGSKIATGEFILFLNPDTVASESAIGKLLDAAKKYPEYGIVSCRQVTEKGKESNAVGQFPSLINLTGFMRAIFGKRFPASGHYKPDTEHPVPCIDFPDWVSGSVILIRNETFKILGGFDEDFWMYFEDVDLCKRVRNINEEIAFCNDVTIEHNHGGSSRINLKTASLTKTEVHISRHVYIAKHKKGIGKFIIQAFLVLNNVISGGILALIGLVMFFIPKVFSRTLIYFRMIIYYAGALFRRSWISPRSVNFNKKR
jgi:GT2 family glycosyltransferase